MTPKSLSPIKPTRSLFQGPTSLIVIGRDSTFDQDLEVLIRDHQAWLRKVLDLPDDYFDGMPMITRTILDFSRPDPDVPAI
jgi:hypothetical protein